MREITSSAELRLITGGEVGATGDEGTSYTGKYSSMTDPALCRSDIYGGAGLGAIAGAATCTAAPAAIPVCTAIGGVVGGGIAVLTSPGCAQNQANFGGRLLQVKNPNKIDTSQD